MEWNYEQRYVGVSMPNYGKKKLIEYKHIAPKRAQYCPYQPDPIKYGKNSDQITHIAESPFLNASDKNLYNKY